MTLGTRSFVEEATESEVKFTMRHTPTVVPVIYLGLCFIWPATSFSQGDKARRSETTVGTIMYLPDAGGSLQGTARTSQYQKLIDDKNYELSTTIRVPSINGGEKLDREISEKSQKINESHVKTERAVRSQDSNGRLSTLEAFTEDRQLKGPTEEIQRSYFRPDINGKMIIQAVENETIATVSKKERQKTRAMYRPDVEGKLSLNELEEGSETIVSDTTVVKESSRKTKDSNGRLSLVGNRRETTTKLNNQSFKKESAVSQADGNGGLSVTEKSVETQTVKVDGTTTYQKVIQSRDINPQIRNVNGTGLILSERITGEERRLPDGAIENTIKVETLDPLDLSKGLRLSEVVTEISRPEGNGKIIVERVTKTRDVNGNYVVSQRISQTVEQRK
jgi:hypothetical protein